MLFVIYIYKYFLLSHCSLFRAPCSLFFQFLLQRRPFHDARRLCKRHIMATNLGGDANQMPAGLTRFVPTSAFFSV